MVIFMKIGLIVNTDKVEAVSCAKDIATMFHEEDAQLCLNNSVKELLSLNNENQTEYFDTDKDIIKSCDAAITVGGDGTIIHNAKYAARYNKPLIGVNLGRIGFVAGIERDEIGELKKLLCGEYKTQRRMLINVTIENDSIKKEYLAVNEAAIARDALCSIIDISVSLNCERIITYRADGMIFSTPTGSTAYSFSSGGPVVEPDMECILLTPVCPHALSSRQVVFRDDSVITATVDNCDVSKSYLVVDGQSNIEIKSGDVITITKAPQYLDLIILKEKNFYTLLNEKLKERH